MEKNAKIYVAGHLGLVGSALVRTLRAKDYTNLLLKSKKELDLTNEQDVKAFFEQEQPDYLFVAAAKVGGILANSQFPADFLIQNLQIQTNLLTNAFKQKVKKTLFLGSSCIYPKQAPQPITEDSLLAGPLEPTNAPYAIAKIAGIALCQALNKQYGASMISLMPTNLYGLNDNFHPLHSHVLPALLRRFHEHKLQQKKEIQLWGTGKPRREFLHADDLADAAIFLMERYDQPEIVNVGWGKDITIFELAALIAQTVGYQGNIVWDTSKPDGTMRKVLSVNKLTALGWQPKISLQEGLKQTYRWMLDHYDEILAKDPK